MGSERRISSATVFTGKILTVQLDRVRLPSGEEAEREVVRHPGAAGVVAVSEGKVLLVRQHRYAPGRDLLEIPAGKLDAGEEPAACAARELEEETGYSAGELVAMGSFFSSPGFSDEVIHLFLAQDLEHRPGTAVVGEVLGSEWMTLEEAQGQIADGSIVDAKTLIGLLLLAGRRLG